jgi:hypothetical protein
MLARECRIPPRVTRIGDQREAPRQITATGAVPAGGPGGQLTERGISG